ncbi:MAG: helix-turn-helix domain-containing protein [Rubrobacteraceae bacterium]
MRGEELRGVEIGERLRGFRRRRMWTQGELAGRAGVSPTTVSGIEGGRIGRPHFGTIRKLARALDLESEALLGGEGPAKRDWDLADLSLSWARSAEEEEFERGLDGASLDDLSTLSQELDEERGRLQRLYGEFPRGSEQQRFIKRQIRDVSAQSGSVTTSMMFQEQRQAPGGRHPSLEEDN